MYREAALRSSRRKPDLGQGTTAWRAFLPDQCRTKGTIIVTLAGKMIIKAKLKEKSGRWTTGKDGDFE
jgi:hypothetical protein